MTIVISEKFPRQRELYRWRVGRNKVSMRAITARSVASIGDENAGFPALTRMRDAMLKRRHLQPTNSLKERLAAFAHDVRRKAAQLPPGPEKDQMLRKARQADTAAHLDDWANSSGLRSPE